MGGSDTGFKAATFLFFPIVVMLLGIIVTASAAANPVPGISGQNAVQFCNPNNPVPSDCLPAGATGTAYFCQPDATFTLGICKILPTCDVTPPAPAWCVGDILQAIFIASATGNPGCVLNFASCGVFLNAGDNVFIPITTIAGDLSSAGALFGFNVIGTNGFITMIGIAIGLVALASLTIFGSGMGSEGVHMLFIGGMLMGIWLILSGLEGFLGGNQGSMFAQLNLAISGVGTFLYVIFTLSYTLGFVGTISRGG